MQAVGSVPWQAYELVDDFWEPRPEHQLTELIEAPTGNDGPIGRKSLFAYASAHLDLGGNAVWGKVFDEPAGADKALPPPEGAPLLEIWPYVIYPIRPISTVAEFIRAYEYQDESVPVEINARRVVHMLYEDPGNLYWGTGRLQAAARTVDTEVEARRWNKIALQNRAVSDGVFTHEYPLTPDQWDEARQRIREQQQGANNARTPWVLGAGAKWQQMGLSPVDMDFIEGLKLSRQEIAAVFDTPLPMVAVMEDATLANFETSRRVFWQDGIIPTLDGLEDSLNRSVTPHFAETPGRRATGRGKEFREWVRSGKKDSAQAKLSRRFPARRGKTLLWLAYDVSGVKALQENRTQQIDDFVKLRATGVTPRRAAELTGIDLGSDDPWVDEQLIDSRLIPYRASVPESGKPPQRLEGA